MKLLATKDAAKVSSDTVQSSSNGGDTNTSSYSESESEVLVDSLSFVMS